MSNLKHAGLYDIGLRKWRRDAMEALTDTEWRVWVKDRLHQADGLPGPDLRVEEAWEDIFLMIIPQLKNQSSAIQGIILAYRDALYNYAKADCWRPDALGALILLARLLIIQGYNVEWAEQTRGITTRLLKKITRQELDNKARDPYTQATYLLKDPGTQPKEKTPIYPKAWTAALPKDLEKQRKKEITIQTAVQLKNQGKQREEETTIYTEAWTASRKGCNV